MNLVTGVVSLVGTVVKYSLYSVVGLGVVLIVLKPANGSLNISDYLPQGPDQPPGILMRTAASTLASVRFEDYIIFKLAYASAAGTTDRMVLLGVLNSWIVLSRDAHH